MVLPVEAFAEISPAELPVGSVLKFRESWALLVSYEDGRTRDLLMLTGDRVGQLFSVTPGMPKCLAVVGPFSWFSAVDEQTTPARAEHRTAALTLTAHGPVIVGARLDGFGDDDYCAFDLDGSVNREHQTYGLDLRYRQWSAELQHRDRPYRSIGRLFSVRVGQD
jgi:hypothetical protein